MRWVWTFPGTVQGVLLNHHSVAFLTFCNFPAPGLHPCIAHVKPPVCPNWDWGLEFQLADALWVAEAQKNCHLVIQTTF